MAATPHLGPCAGPSAPVLLPGRWMRSHDCAAHAGAQVVEFVRGEEYARFSRIVFDTAPTGHTLRLLTVPDFVEAALGESTKGTLESWSWHLSP